MEDNNYKSSNNTSDTMEEPRTVGKTKIQNEAYPAELLGLHDLAFENSIVNNILLKIMYSGRGDSNIPVYMNKNRVKPVLIICDEAHVVAANGDMHPTTNKMYDDFQNIRQKKG